MIVFLVSSARFVILELSSMIPCQACLRLSPHNIFSILHRLQPAYPPPSLPHHVNHTLPGSTNGANSVLQCRHTAFLRSVIPQFGSGPSQQTPSLRPRPQPESRRLRAPPPAKEGPNLRRKSPTARAGPRSPEACARRSRPRPWTLGVLS